MPRCIMSHVNWLHYMLHDECLLFLVFLTWCRFMSCPCPSIPYKVPYQLQAQITSINAFNTTMPAYDKRAQVISLTDASTYHQGSYITMMQCIGNSCHNYHGNSWLLNVSSPHVHLCRFHLMMPPAITMSSRLKFNAVRPMPLPTGLVHGRGAERFAKRSKKDLLLNPYHWVEGFGKPCK